MESIYPPLMFVALMLFLLSGYPVAFGLAGTALLFAAIGAIDGSFQIRDFGFVPKRLFGVMQNVSLMSVPLFIVMGLILERSQLAQDLLGTAERCMRRFRGGLALAVIVVGALIAAATGIVGATVVTLGVMSLPVMLKSGYDKRLACGTIAASGTLGQIIPPSVVLIILGDLLNVPVGDLFMGALIPGLLLVGSYMLYVVIAVRVKPAWAPMPAEETVMVSWPVLLKSIASGIIPAGGLIILVLGTIMAGVATPTEAAACGAIGALIIAGCKRRLSWTMVRQASIESAKMTAMVFTILAGAQLFTIVFRGVGGEHWLVSLVQGIDPSPVMAVAIIMVMMFVLGFFLDFLEICFIVIPMVLPMLRHVGWNQPEQLLLLAVLMGVNLQTSFLTPPFGFSLFYLKGCAPPGITTGHIYRGIIPFVLIQLAILALIVLFPEIALWLPRFMART